MFGIEIDVLTMDQAIDVIRSWVQGPAAPCRFIVTPNVDHVVMLQEHEALQAAYRDADLVLADGFPLIVASRLLGKRLPERVAGSELVPALLAAFTGRSPLRLFLLGAAPGVADRGAAALRERHTGLDVVGTYSPPLGFEHDAMENARILERVRRAAPDLLIVGLGAPKQELWVHRHRNALRAKVALCVGATIDFLAGEKRQAPRWMRRTGLEWLHRVACEPRRLAARYAKDARRFPAIVWKEWAGNRNHAPSASRRNSAAMKKEPVIHSKSSGPAD